MKMRKRGGLTRMAEFETRVRDLAVAKETRLRSVLQAATAGPGYGQQHRSPAIADALLAADDPALLARLQTAARFMTPDERAQVERRIRRTLEPSA